MRPRRSSSAWLPLALAAAVPSAAAGQDGSIVSGAAFLLLPVGARASGVGQAGATAAGSSEAVFWNPAGLALLRSSEFGVQYARTFATDNTALSVYLRNDRLGTLGVTAYLVDYGSQETRPPDGGLPGGRVAPKNVELLASYATEVGSAVALGVSYKLVQFRQDCQGDCGTLGDVSGTTHAVDVGAQVVLGAAEALRLGIVVRHAGFKLQLQNKSQADPLPTQVAVGVEYRLPLAVIGASPDFTARVVLDLQDDWGEYGSPDARTGVEVAYAEAVFLRGGYAFLQAESGGASLGIGLRFHRLTIDLTRLFYQTGVFEDPLHVGLRIHL
jgi:hypothetical protein